MSRYFKFNLVSKVHWAIVVLSLALTAAVWNMSKSFEKEKEALRFKQRSEVIVSHVIERLEKYELALWSGVALINTLENQEIDRETWSKFSETLKIQDRYPGIMGIGVIDKVKRSNLSKYLKKQNRELGVFNVFPEHDIDTLYPIRLIEPLKSNSKAFGLDIAHEKNRLAGAERASLSGLATVTGPIVLVQDAKKTPGFLFFAPFYSKKSPKELLGLVYSPFISRNLVSGVLSQEKTSIGIKIFDNGVTLYDGFVGRSRNKGLSHVIDKAVYGRTWRFEITQNKLGKAKEFFTLSRLVLIAGLVVDFLLIIVFFLLVRSKNAAVVLSEKLSLKAEKQSKIVASTTKMAALGEMASGIAHEVNNPLSIISAHINRLKILSSEGVISKELVQDTCLKIDETVVRISAIINALKQYSSKDGFDNSAVDLVLVIRQSFDLCSEKFKSHGVALEFVCDQAECLVLGRKVEISQVILNFLNNAFDAVENLECKWVRFSLDQENDFTILTITDSGLGIDKDVAALIKDPFFTTKEVGRGTGLGLSISVGLLETMSASFEYDDKASNTQFKLKFTTFSETLKK